MDNTELNTYREQISIIDAELPSLVGQQRREMEESRADLLELVALLEEQMEECAAASTSSSVGTSERVTPTTNREEDSTLELDESIDCDDLVGLRVSAPFPRSHLPISHHTAIVLEVLPPIDVEQGVLAKVLYSTPLLPSMKPCSHFLSGTCRFEDKCKFNHGEVVPMKDLEEYVEPDFSRLQVGSLVLVSIDKGLWDVGRVRSRDGDQSAVALLKSGKEVSATSQGIIPLDAEIEQEDVNEAIHVPNDSWSELKGERLGSVTVGDLGNWNGGGVGLKMMQKMGFQMGQGLGKRNDGIVHAIQAEIHPKKKGLDCSGDKKKRVVGQETKKRLRKGLSGTGGGLDRDIFQFLNRKLDGEQAGRNELQLLKEEKREMNKCSEKSLGIKGMDLETELNQLRSKEKKLHDGIRRNQNDPRTVARMRLSLEGLQKEISRKEGSHTRLHRELHDRKRKKEDIF